MALLRRLRSTRRILRVGRADNVHHTEVAMRRVLLGFVLVASIVGCQAAPESVATTGASTAAPTGSAAAVVTTPSPAPSASAAPAATVTPAPTAPATPTPSPTPKPTPKPIVACVATQLKAKVTGWSGAMGSQIADVTLTNASSTTCKVQGTPGVELIDAHGFILIDSQTAGASGLPHVSPGDHVFLLAHNGVVRTEVSVANYCGSRTPVLPTTVAFVLPSNAGKIAAAPGPGGGVPDCLGAPGSAGDISMNGWVK